MAVGGVPDMGSLNNQYAENLQEQDDEIMALESIFEGDEGRLQILSRAQPLSEDLSQEDDTDASGNMLKILIPMKPFDDKLHIDVYLPLEEEQLVNGSAMAKSDIKYARSESGQRIIWSCDVTYLPPMCLYLTLPPAYPSEDAPSYQLSCVWLSPSQLTFICRQLDELWYGGGQGMPIIYTWVDWLQENLLSSLGIESQHLISTHILDDDVDDCRVTMDTTDMNQIVTMIMRYNTEKEVQDFYETTQTCGVCFDEQLGSKFFLLADCRHHACRECLTAHCQLQVKEGTVQQLKCPMYECKESLPEYILHDILTEEEFKRYQGLALQKALDTMGDIAWCPRCNSPVVQEPEKSLNLAHCLTCFYSFCTDCHQAWHQGEKCSLGMSESEKETLEEKTQKEIEHRAEMVAKRRRIENAQSYQYLNKMAKRCPTCAARVMKTGGCNKVVCTNCCTSMCWKCLKIIEGYSHFSDNPKCNTFSLNEEFDNTDLPGGMFYIPQAPPRPQVVRPKPRFNDIELRLKLDPELRATSAFRCGACKQNNIKEDNCNHIICWNCKTNLCFQCKQRITGPIGKHYHGAHTCDQHS